MGVELPVIEIFGPTIQGEGPEAGRPVSFVRLGGCDYRCSWCDSMFAVEPAEVRANAERLTPAQIVDRLVGFKTWARWIVLSGGNPALHRCDELVELLHERHFWVAVETQGTVWRDWLGEVDRLVVSPKPPSSGMDGDAEPFMRKALDRLHLIERTALKVVVFDNVDLQYARRVHRRWPSIPFYLSAGTAQDGDHREAAIERFRWLAEAVAGDLELADAVVLPQLHVIAWGAERAR